MSQVLIRDFPTAVGQWRVSPQGGLRPRWSRDGRFIYYWKLANLEPGSSSRFQSTDTLFRVQIDVAPSVVVRAPEFIATMRTGAFVWWDLHPDGRRFIVAIPNSGESESASGASGTSRHIVVLNWFTELNELADKRR